YAGYGNIWGDWAAHLTYAGSFAFGHNFPPEFPVDPGHHLGYPFMVDFLAADLVPLRLSLPATLPATSGMLGLAFPTVLSLAALGWVQARVYAARNPLARITRKAGLAFVARCGARYRSHANLPSPRIRHSGRAARVLGAFQPQA